MGLEVIFPNTKHTRYIISKRHFFRRHFQHLFPMHPEFHTKLKSLIKLPTELKNMQESSENNASVESTFFVLKRVSTKAL